MPDTQTVEKVEQAVTEALVEFGADPGEVSREATFEMLDVDSLDLAEMAQIVEEKFGVELKGNDVKEVKTVGEMIDLIASRA